MSENQPKLNSNELFPFVPSDRPVNLKPKEHNGDVVVVNDLYQVAVVDITSQTKVIERAVSSCTILQVTTPKERYYFHLPSQPNWSLFEDKTAEFTLNQRAFKMVS